MNRESQATSILETAADAIVCADAAGRIVSFNPAAERLFGYSASDVIGENVRVLMPAPLRDEHDEHMRLYVSTGDPHVIGTPGREVTALRADGTTFPALLGVGEWYDADARMFTAIIHDLSAIRSLAEQFREAQKMEAVSALASGVAHDFNNLLQGIIGCLNLALRPENTSDRARVYIERALDAARRGAGVSNQLLALSRHRTNEPRRALVDDTIRTSLSLMRRLLGAHIRLDFAPAADAAVIVADPVHVEQILLNLASNAADAMPSGGVFTITTRRARHDELPAPLGAESSDEFVRVSVRDNGTGMSASTRERIFEPFFTTKKPGSGTGLGLPMVYTVLGQLGGGITVKSEEGDGTEFVLFLPCDSNPPDDSPDDDPERDVGRYSGDAIVVEDDRLVCLTISHYLEDLGFTVSEARNPSDALAALALRTSAPAIVVADVLLPGMSGPALVDRLRERFPGLPSLLVSANAPSELVERGVVDEGAAVLEKPFERSRLAAMIAAVMAA